MSARVKRCQPRAWRSMPALLVPVLLALAGCGPEPVHDPSAGLSPEQAIALIDTAPRSEVALTDLVEAYAFGSTATDARREALANDVIGHAVEWDIPVNGVSVTEDRYRLTTPAIETRNRAEAVPVLKVAAFVISRGPADEQRLLRLRTDQTVRVRGIVQEIRDQKAVAIVPAVLVP